jgi:hypothetical protein
MCRKKHLLSDEKLQALRTSDPFREWNSLDDKRVCFLCERTITGRQIEVTRNSDRGYKLRCPTEGCRSSPHEWLYPGNPYLSEETWHDWERLFDEEVTRSPSRSSRKLNLCLST